MTVMKKRPCIHVISETAFAIQGQGVHTAFLDCIELLKRHGDIQVVVNGEGWGDLMHAHSYGPYYFWKGRRYRGRRVFTAHVIPDSIKGSLPMGQFLMPLARWYLRHVYSYADVCIAISPTVEKTIRDLNAKTRIVQIQNPIDVDRFSQSSDQRAASRKALRLPDDAFVVLGVGQLERRKGIEDFLDIAQACPDLVFIWAGGRPFGVATERIATVNKRIRAASEHAKFLGILPFEDMPAIYSAADLFLFPSYQENCPLAPLEAAASGLPVIYRDIPEYLDLYEHPYLKARNTDEFVAMTKRMATNPAFLNKGRSMSRNLLTQFDNERIRKQLIAVYGEVIESQARG